MHNEFVIRGVKMLKPSGEVATADIFVTGDKISKITPSTQAAKFFAIIIQFIFTVNQILYTLILIFWI